MEKKPNGIVVLIRNEARTLNWQKTPGDSRQKFAIGDASYANYTRIYGLVQCTPDLSEVQCSNCLDRSFRDITNAFNGKQGGRVIGPSCNFRYEIDQFYEIPPPPSPPATAPPPPTTTDVVPPTGGGGNKTRTIIIVVVSTVCFVILIICIFFFLQRRNRRKKLESVDKIGADALQLDFGTVKAATNNFSNDNKLGQGGFGSVYKGKLAGGQEIAVKRLASGSGQGDLEFKNEVVLVAKLQHRNLVRLLGFCLEGQERLLIYEFVANASLDQFLFDPAKRSYLNWERRYKIIGGVARGLLYLHEDSRLRIIHRDLKASNILLDEEMHPKIADFGMARLFIMDQTQGNTSRIVGTYGYMAPEYAMHGQFSVKSDVYSFGVLLLELVSGQKNNCFRVGETVEDLISFAWGSWRAGTAARMIDPTIINGPRNEIMRCIHIGLLCVQESVAARPTMASVVLMLSSFSLTLPLPSEPAFFVHSSVDAERPMLADYSSGTSISSYSKGVSDNFSRNDVSITDMDPR
uniref:Cysteine-rich receptor-like protein kinase 29 n=1 Tax=Kalanchoe fedtschenkoi TaxID=63787 RepID=A0A7N0TRZ8_KALFE